MCSVELYFLYSYFVLFIVQMLQWVADNLPDGEKKNNLQKLLETKTYSVKFISYNWDLNSSWSCLVVHAPPSLQDNNNTFFSSLQLFLQIIVLLSPNS